LLERADCGRHVLLGVPHAPATEQHVDHCRVRVEIERGEHEPLVQTPKSLLARAWQLRHQLAEKREVHLAVALSLRGQPAGELRVSVDLDALEQVAAEEIAGLRKTLGRCPRRPSLDHALDFDGVDEGIREIEGDRPVSGRLNTPAIGIVQQRPELAETPSKLAARIVRDVPQQGA
jgi:hypothetical protein